MAAEARVVVFVTAPVADVEVAIGLVRQILGRDVQVVYVVSPNDDLARAYLSAGPSQVVVCPLAWRDLVGTASRLRHLPHDVTVVLFSRSRHHRRLKLMSLYVGRGRLLVCQESGDAFFAGVRSLATHAVWRVREQVRIRLDLARAAWRLLSSQGFGELARRARHRIARKFDRLGSRVRFWWYGRAWPRFALPVHRDPDVSLVIPAHGKWPVTRRCLRSVALNSGGVRYEVVLVDDGSPDQTRAAARRVTGLKVVAFDENRGFVAACNAGAGAATGRYVLFLNNDTVVTPGWLPPLLRTFVEQRDCGAVGAKLLYPNGKLQEAGSIVWREGNGYNYGKHDDPALPEYNYVRRTDYCSGAVLMVRRDVFTSLDGFDTQFAPGYWEDADLCFSLARKGLVVWFQPASVVYHLEGTTAGTDASRGMKRFQVENRDKFRRKWAAALTHQIRFDPRQLFLARDRNRGPLVLVFDHYVPTPDRDAGSVFMDRLLDELTHRGCRVVFWPDNLFASPGYTERLQQRGIEVVYGRVSLGEYLRKLGRKADAAIAYRSHIAAKFLPIVRAHSAALGYILCDLESLRESRRIELDGEVGSEFEALRQRETETIAVADCIGVHSPVERTILQGLAPQQRVFHLPLPGPSIVAGALSFEERRDLIFVGGTHPPNVDAISHFAREIWPAVRDQLGPLTLRVAGDVCRSVPHLAHRPGVELLGHVPDLGESLGRARVFVSPLRYGAGIKGKVLAAMTAGVPVVTTPVGAEGIGLVHGRSALIAETDADFASHIVRLYRDRSLWEAVRRDAMVASAEGHSADRFREAVADFVNALLGPRDLVPLPDAFEAERRAASG